MEDAAESAAGQTVKDRTEKAANAEATWRERALDAEEIIKADQARRARSDGVSWSIRR
ncbi:hypothetical protein AB0D34_18695 [Streptomyces sp. NPDC048420]|uniref:hypothetical protein n=1 Tax=Streptomyces sp. NPDC048420 TaxID=3155755 RepID=UPI00341E4B90